MQLKLRGAWVPDYCSQPLKKTCPDGSEIVVKDCKDNRYADTGNTCEKVGSGEVVESGSSYHMALGAMVFVILVGLFSLYLIKKNQGGD